MYSILASVYMVMLMVYYIVLCVYMVVCMYVGCSITCTWTQVVLLPDLGTHVMVKVETEYYAQGTF